MVTAPLEGLDEINAALV